MWARGFVLFGSVLVLSNLSSASVAAERGACAALAEIADLCNRVQSLRVRYRGYGYAEQKPAGSYLERAILAQSPCFLYHMSGHGHRDLSIADDPLRQEAYVGEEFSYNVYPLNRIYLRMPLSPNDRLPGTLNDEFYFHATGLWPLRSRPAPRVLDGPHMLTELASSDRYHFSDKQNATIDGVRCDVIERGDGADRLWLDLSRGYCLLRRELRDPKSNALAARYDLRNHTEVQPRVWLPRRMYNKQFDYLRATSAQREPQPVIDSVLEVLELETTPLDPRVFRYEPPPGSVERYLNSAKAPRQTHAGGKEHLEFLIAWIRRTAMPVANHKAAKQTSAWTLLALIGCGSGCAIVAVELCFFRRSVKPK